MKEDLLFVSLTVENILFASRLDYTVDTTATAVDVIVQPPVEPYCWRVTGVTSGQFWCSGLEDWN